MRRRVIRTAAAGLLAAATTIGLTPNAQAADMMTPTPTCDLPRDQWPGTVDIHQGGQLSSGQRLVAKDSPSTLVMQPDGNLVLSLVNDKGGALWPPAPGASNPTPHRAAPGRRGVTPRPRPPRPDVGTDGTTQGRRVRTA